MLYLPSDIRLKKQMYMKNVLPLIFFQARFVFGNRLVASTLILTTDKAECCYSTKQAACSLDHFMHVVKSKAENFRVCDFGF